MNLKRTIGMIAAAAVTTMALGLVASPSSAGTPATGSVPAGGLLADFNNDGRADIVAINPSGNLLLYLNNGAPNYFLGTNPKVVGSGWSGYALDAVGDPADLGDDILATAPNGNLVEYREGANYTFAGPYVIGTGWSGMRVVGLDDLDGTGDPGLLAIDPQGTLRFYADGGPSGNADVSFSGYVGVGSGWTGFAADVAQDFSGGLVAVDPQGRLLFYPHTPGYESFVAPAQIGAGWSGFRAIDVGAVTASHSTDLVAINAGGSLLLYSEVVETRTATHPTFQSPVAIGTGWTGYRID